MRPVREKAAKRTMGGQRRFQDRCESPSVWDDILIEDEAAMEVVDSD